MIALRHRCLLSPLLLALLVIGCDRVDPLQPAIQAASSAGSGSAPAAPSGTSAIATSESQIDISWQDNSTDETGFEVYRSTNGPSGKFTRRASTSAGVTRYSDAGLSPSTQYCYKVRAFGTSQSSYSRFSAASCATTPALSPPPSAPSMVNATLYLDYAIPVSWADNSSNEVGFRVERSTDGGTSWLTVATTAVNSTAFGDYSFPSEQLACYRVFAFNGMGDSPPSNIACDARPAAPGPLTFALVDSATVDLAWADNSGFEDGYLVMGTWCYDVFAPIAVLPANATSVRLNLSDWGWGYGGGWIFYLRALKGAGYSYPSDQLVVDPDGKCP